MSQNNSVPFDGDIAHRRGFALVDNPWPEHDPNHKEWASDWRFRHKHALRDAADAEGGRLRPSELNRSVAS